MIIDSVSPGLTYSLFHQFPRAPLCRMQYSRRPPAQHAAPTWPPSLLIIIVTVAGYIAAISRLIARLFALFPRFCPRPARAISRTCRRSVFFIRQRTAETCRMSSRVKPETCRVLSYGGRRQTKDYLCNRQSLVRPFVSSTYYLPAIVVSTTFYNYFLDKNSIRALNEQLFTYLHVQLCSMTRCTN